MRECGRGPCLGYGSSIFMVGSDRAVREKMHLVPSSHGQVGFGTVERKGCPLLEVLMELLSLLWTSFESCHATLGLAEKSILTSSNLSDNKVHRISSSTLF
ncbi:hypothetical protein NC651_029987 [Populus alba x Populus x berolinensis]|nr:hypothetical protein NC651_029987 [Populus alba x Populus x berolinensis]